MPVTLVDGKEVVAREETINFCRPHLQKRGAAELRHH